MNELVTQLVSKIGINPEQAQGGLGAILSLAQKNLNSETFSKITNNIDGSNEMIAKFANLASENKSGLGGLLNTAVSALGSNSDLGGLAQMATNLSSLNLDLDTLKKFAPVVSGFLRQKDLGDIADKIDSLV